MTRRPPADVALAATGVSVLAASALTSTVHLGDSISFPAVLVGVVAAGGMIVAQRRWSGPDVRPAPVNLAVSFGVAFLLIVTRATVGSSTSTGLHPVAEVFLIVLAVRAPVLTDPNRLRSALLMSMGALLAAASTEPLQSSLALIAVWLVAALTTLVALIEETSTGLPRLGPEPPPARGRRVAPIVAAVIAVAIAAVVVSAIDPDPGRTAPRSGASDARAPQGRYDSLAGSLDTSDRFTPSHEVVMTVQAPAPDFWRGQSYDRWDGRQWTSTTNRARYRVPGSGYLQGGIGDVDAGGQVFVQRITVKAPSMALVFGAYRIDQVDTPASGLVAHGDGSLEVTRPLGRGAEYTVVSQRLAITPSLLRSHDPAEGSIPPYLADLYLQLPAEPGRIAALAHQIGDGEPTAYDKVLAIHRWLAANVSYTLDIPPLPDGADAVDQFLFVDRKGFCEQIASASAVLLRDLGIPARVATGYVPGDESLLGGEFTVHADDAHAWVEVWYPGLGWQPFDPTASVPLAGRSATAAGERLADIIGRLAPWLIGIGALVLVAAGGALAIGALRRRRAFKAAPWAHRTAVRLERAGQARGRQRLPSESPAEYATALATTVVPDERIVTVGATVSRAAYGAAEPTDEEQAWVDAVLTEALKANPPRRHRPRSN